MRLKGLSLFPLCFCRVPYRYEVVNILCKHLLVVGSIPQKIVLQKLVCAPALLWVLDKTLVYKVLEDGGPALFKRRRIFLNDVHDNSVLRLADIRGVAICNLHREDTETPNINLCVVPSFTLNKLRSHPANSANF